MEFVIDLLSHGISGIVVGVCLVASFEILRYYYYCLYGYEFFDFVVIMASFVVFVASIASAAIIVVYSVLY
jgi:hypothetical protein